MQPITREYIEIRRPPDVRGIETARVERSGKLWRAFHDSYNVCAVIDSTGVVWRRGKEVNNASTGDILFARPGDLTLSTALARPQSFVALSISASLIESAAEQLGLTNGMPEWRSSQMRHPSLFTRLVHHHSALEKAGCRFEAESALADCLPLLLEHCFERRARVAAISARPKAFLARDYIHDNFACRFGMEALSDAVSMSRYHLSRAFRAEFGLSPHDYLMQVRLSKARELLGAGIPIRRVATETGFADQSHLVRRFGVAFAITPGQYVRAAKSARTF